MSMPLLSTKLSVKLPRADFVPRPYLVERLNEGAKQKLTLICAPAGFGKSTLVSIWAQQATHSVSWLELDAGDNDPMRFLAYLVAACQQAVPEVGQIVNEILASFQLMSLAYPLTLLINQIAQQSQAFSLVLDDYHLISNSIVHQGVRFLLDHLPPTMHLLIVSRQTPRLPLSRLRARGHVTEIGATELRLSRAQMALFFCQTMRLQIRSEALDALFAQTEGWVASLQLVALSLQKRSDATRFIEAFGGSNNLLYDYLAEEVMQQQTDDMRDFLRQTAIVEQFNASLCHALTGKQNSQILLRQLEQANLFLIPLDDKRQWYRYHHLFADFLRTPLSDVQLAPLHQKAARWYGERGLIREAIPHALAAEAFEFAVELILSVSEKMLQSSEVVTLWNWVQKLPEPFVQTSYQLCTYKGWMAFLILQRERATSYAQLAEELAQGDYGPLTALRAVLAISKGDISNALELSMQGLAQIEGGSRYTQNQLFRNALLNNLGEALLLDGDTSKAVGYFRQAIFIGNRISSDVAAYAALYNLGTLLHLQGKRQEAMNVCQQGLEQCQATFGPKSPFATLMHIVLGMGYYEANQLSEAESHLLTGLELSQSLRDISGPGMALKVYAIYAQLQQASNRYEAALNTLQEATQLIPSHRDLLSARLIRAITAKIHLQQGHIAEAVEWAQGVTLSFKCCAEYMLENEQLIYVRVLLAQHKIAQAQTLLAELEQVCQHRGFNGRLVIIRILQTRAWQALGDDKQALTALSSAIRLAAPNQYLRHFIEEAHTIGELLPQACADAGSICHIAPTFVNSLLQSSPNSSSNARSTTQPLIEALSERELEVLQLIAQGLTNQQIANRLFVSLSTAKWHTRNIYGKLSVRKRTQAVARARELGLL